MEEYNRFQREVKKLQLMNEQLQAKLTDSANHCESITNNSQSLKRKNDELNKEVIECQMRYDSLQATATTAIQSLKRKNDELNKEVKQLNLTNEKIQAKLTDTEIHCATVRSADVESLKRKNDELNKEVQQLELMIKQTQAKLIDSEKHSADLTTDRQSLEKKNDELKQEIIAFKARLDMLGSGSKNKDRSALLRQKRNVMDSSDDEEALQDCPQESYSPLSSSRKKARFISPSNQRLSHKEHREESFNSNDDLKLELRRCLQLLQDEKKSHSETLKKLQMEKLDHNEILEKWKSLL